MYERHCAITFIIFKLEFYKICAVKALSLSVPAIAQVFSTMRLICENPHEWAAAFGFAIQKIVDGYKEQLVLGAALTIVMESAVPMSRINLFEYFSDKRLLI